MDVNDEAPPRLSSTVHRIINPIPAEELSLDYEDDEDLDNPPSSPAIPTSSSPRIISTDKRGRTNITINHATLDRSGPEHDRKIQMLANTAGWFRDADGNPRKASGTMNALANVDTIILADALTYVRWANTSVTLESAAYQTPAEHTISSITPAVMLRNGLQINATGLIQAILTEQDSPLVQTLNNVFRCIRAAHTKNPHCSPPIKIYAFLGQHEACTQLNDKDIEQLVNVVVSTLGACATILQASTAVWCGTTVNNPAAPWARTVFGINQHILTNNWNHTNVLGYPMDFYFDAEAFSPLPSRQASYTAATLTSVTTAMITYMNSGDPLDVPFLRFQRRLADDHKEDPRPLPMLSASGVKSRNSYRATSSIPWNRI